VKHSTAATTTAAYIANNGEDALRILNTPHPSTRPKGLKQDRGQQHCRLQQSLLHQTMKVQTMMKRMVE